MAVDETSGIAVVENRSKVDNRGLTSLVGMYKDSNAKRMSFLKKLDKEVMDLERRLQNG